MRSMSKAGDIRALDHRIRGMDSPERLDRTEVRGIVTQITDK